MRAAETVRLLIVEDNADDALVMLQELRRHGTSVLDRRVQTAAEMRDALATQSWDAILADYSLPSFSAPAALAILKESGQDLPFIIVTGSLGEEVAAECMRAGAHDFICKANLARLAPALEREIRDAGIRRSHSSAQAERESSHRRFRALVENLPTAIGLLAADGTISYDSPALSRILGYGCDELTGTCAFDLVHPHDREAVVSAFGRSVDAPGGTGFIEHRCRHKDGRWVVMRSTAQSHLEDPDIGAIVVNSQDVTDQKSAETALVTRERELDTLTRNGPDIIVRLDRELRHVFVNHAMERFTGIPSHEFIGRTNREMGIPEDLIEHLESNVRSVLETGESRTLEFQFDTPLGRRWFQTGIAPEFGDTRVESVVTYTRDITDLKVANEATKASESRFRALIEGGTDLVYIVSETGEIMYVSPSVERTLGYSVDERRGRQIFELFHPGDREEARMLLAEQASGSGKNIEARVRVRHADDSWRVVEIAGRSHLQDPHIGGLVIHVRDVTKRMELENELRHAQKMEAVGRLAGGVAHDFNNLLTVISGNAQMALGDLPPSHPSREELEEIGHAAERATELTQQLLAFSRRQVLDPRDLDLSQHMSEMKKMLLRLVGEDIQVVSDLVEEGATVRADPGQLEQVVMNLVVNARDAMPTGGQLKIQTRLVSIDEPGLRIGSEILPEGAYVQLSVTDAGHGMDEKTISQIFDPSFTTKEATKGTGLGLSTVYGIVKQSGGAVGVLSEPGKGTTFCVYLPRVAVVASSQRQSQKLVPAAPRSNGSTVLLVEDDENVRSLLRKMLTRWSYSVLEARDGQEAVDLSSSYAGEIDLLITDVVMPAVSGPEAARRIVMQRPGIRVLFMSGYTDEALDRQGITGDEAALLMKPITPVTLAHKLDELFAAAVSGPADGMAGGVNV
ncbi:MAG: PAS domain S-box protein [Gemmatimonadetes bacterium]|nr:PAS domain S-box protein [Gemmatimonadota bacterium]